MHLRDIIAAFTSNEDVTSLCRRSGLSAMEIERLAQAEPVKRPVVFETIIREREERAKRVRTTNLKKRITRSSNDVLVISMETQIRAWTEIGKTMPEMAEEAGLSLKSIRDCCRRLGLKPKKAIPRPFGRRTEVRNQYILEMAQRGHTYAKIADRFGVTRERVAQIVLKTRPSVAAFVTPHEKRIAALRNRAKRIAQMAETNTLETVAQEYGITKQRVGQIVRRERNTKKLTNF